MGSAINFLVAGFNLRGAIEAAIEGRAAWALVLALLSAFSFGVALWLRRMERDTIVMQEGLKSWP